MHMSQAAPLSTSWGTCPARLLSVLVGPWKGITCNLIVDLSLSNRFIFILVFVDCFTKMCHAVPCWKTTTIPEFMKLFFNSILHLQIHIIFALAALKQWEVHGMDVIMAFL